MRIELKKFILICPLALLTLIIPSVLGSNQLLSVIFLLLVILLMFSIEWSFKNLIFFVLVAISGPVAESIGIYFGKWIYFDSLFNGIPAWLPLVWGNAGLYILRLKKLIYSFPDVGHPKNL